MCVCIMDVFNQRLLQFVGQLDKPGNEAPVLWSSRLQDSELQEMVDSGNCLSIGQPYASLIIEGIKR